MAGLRRRDPGDGQLLHGAVLFLSGLFVWPSLQRKSTASFLYDRLLRLGLPFAVAALTLMPLAYYAFEPRVFDMSFTDYWWKTITVGPWPSGPVWFVWVLFAFDIVAALLYRIAPRCLDFINRLSVRGFADPVPFFVFFAAFTTLVYLPMRLYFGATHWFEFGGPFVVQASRVPALRQLFPSSAQASALPPWTKACCRPRGGSRNIGTAGRWSRLVAYSFLVLLIVYKRGFAADPDICPLGMRSPTASPCPCSAPRSPSASSHSICASTNPAPAFSMPCTKPPTAFFLVHYVPILWMQYWLRDVDLPAAAKALSLFVVALLSSWAVTAALLRIPGARRVL